MLSQDSVESMDWHSVECIFFFAVSTEIKLKSGLLMLIQNNSRRKEEFCFKWKGIVTPCSLSTESDTDSCRGKICIAKTDQLESVPSKRNYITQ